MAVARVGCFKQHRLGLGRHQRAKHLIHRNVADMRALIIAPANMHADLFSRNIRQGMVQRVNMAGRDLDKFIIRQIVEQHMTGQRQIRAIQLQVQTRGDNRLVLCLHRIRQSGQIRLAGLVIVVLQKQRNHTRRCSIHETTINAMRGHRSLQVGNILFQFALPLGLHLANTHRAGILRATTLLGQPL